MKSLVVFYAIVLYFDLANLGSLRELVYSFLLSNHNRKTARKIHNAQSRKNKLTLSYIKDYTVYPRHFVFWYRFSFVYLFSLILQYAAVITVNFFSVNLTFWFLVVLFGIKIIIVLVIHSQFSGRISRFDKAYLEKIRKRRKR